MDISSEYLVSRAALCREFGKPMTIEQVHLRWPGPEEVLVKVEASAVCHSDISYLKGDWAGMLPAVYGHEVAGTVLHHGDNVKSVAIGDRVMVTAIRDCGTCPACAVGESFACENPYDRTKGPISLPDGTPVQHGVSVGGFSEYVCIDKSQVVKLSSDISMAAASLLSCGVITGVGAVINTANLRPGQTAVVIGAGGVGLNAIQGAYIAGASRIFAVDVTKEKLAAAKKFGATDVLLDPDDDPVGKVRTETARGVDFVFVTVGAAAIYNQAHQYLSRRGKIIAVGMTPAGQAACYEPLALAAQSQSIIGSIMGSTNVQRDIPWLLSLYHQGRLKLDELVTGTWALEDINEAVAVTKSGNGNRQVVLFDHH